MRAFEFDHRLIDSYARFSRSFSTIRSEDLKSEIGRQYDAGRFWPNALLSLNPRYLQGQTVDDLVRSGDLDEATGRIFRSSTRRACCSSSVIAVRNARSASRRGPVSRPLAGNGASEPDARERQSRTSSTRGSRIHSVRVGADPRVPLPTGRSSPCWCPIMSDRALENVSMLPLEFQPIAFKWIGTYPSKNTRDTYSRALRHVLTFFCDKLNRTDLALLSAIPPELIADLQDYLALNENAPATIETDIAALRSFARAVYRENRSINVTGLIMARRSTGGRRHRARVTKSSLTEHLEADRELAPQMSRSPWIVARNEAICKLLADTGAKAAHVVALDYPAAVQARSTGTIILGGNIERKLPVSSETIAAIDHYLASCEFPFDDHSPLFVDHNGERLSAQVAAACLGRMTKRLGSGCEITPSGIRRNRVIELFEKEHLPETIIAERLGISTVSIVSEILSDAGCFDRFREGL